MTTNQKHGDDDDAVHGEIGNGNDDNGVNSAATMVTIGAAADPQV